MTKTGFTSDLIGVGTIDTLMRRQFSLHIESGFTIAQRYEELWDSVV